MAAPRKSPQILTLEPAEELVFEGPFDRVVTSYLELKNPSEQRVCFKVKTTAPHRYGVRPNSGVIQPSGKIRIAIMFHPTEKDTQSERARHKFMVQSTILRREATPGEIIWKEAKSEEVMDSKLRCIFRHADSGLETRDAPSSSSSSSTTAPTAPSMALATGTAGMQQPPAAVAPQQPATVPQQPTSTQQPQHQHQQQQQSATKHQQQQQSATKQPASRFISSSSDGGEPSSYNNSSASLDITRDLTTLHRPMLVISFIVFIVGVILGKYII